MSSGIEPVELIDPWIFGKLSTDPALIALVADRITNGANLGALATPFITWNMNSARDITSHDGTILWCDTLFEIKAIGQGGSFSVPAKVAKRVHELIHGVKNEATAQGGTITCHRERVVRYPELDDNIQFRHVGAVYRIQAHT